MSVPPPNAAPDGAQCSEHPEREAFFTCPRCGSYSCLFCWHSSLDRCDACIRRDPTEAVPPIAWEDAARDPVGRLLGTLGGAFRPSRTGPAMARDDVSVPVGFFLLSVLPLAMLAGVIPHTRTLLFGAMQVQVLGTPAGGEIGMDIARAMAAQVALTAVELLALALPFASLVRAYAPEGRRAAAIRFVLYRGWLLPMAGFIFGLVAWTAPLSAADTGAPAWFGLLMLVPMLINAFLWVGMWLTARLGCGLGPLMASVVTAVPFVLWMVVQPVAGALLNGLLPATPGLGG